MAHPFIFTNRNQQYHTNKNSLSALKQTMDSELQETSISVPKMVELITIVPPIKVKGKSPTKSGSKKKKRGKSNVGTPETTLSMVDKETPIVSAVVKPNVGTS
jgi:hypothetical protein